MSEARIDVVIGSEKAESGANVITRAIDRIKESASGLEARMGLMSESIGVGLRIGAAAAGVAGVAIGAAVIASTRATLEYRNEIGRMAQATNLSAQQASEFAYAAKFADTSVTSLTSGLSRLNQNIGEARAGTGDGAQLFRALGVSITDANGKVRGTGDVFKDVIGKVGEFRNDAQKSSIVAKLLGEDLQQMARLGKAGLSDLAQEAHALGVVLSEEDLQAAEHFKQQITRLEATLMGLKLRIGEAVLPVINTLLDKLAELATGRPSPVLTPPPGGGSQAPPLGQPGEDRKRIDAERARREKAMQDELGIVERGLQTQSQLYDADAKQQFILEERLTKSKLDIQQKGFSLHGDMLNRQLELEYEFHKRVLGIAGLTAKDRIAEDERYRNKVFDINQEIRKVVSDANNQEMLSDAELFAARERDRRKAFDDTQIFYQGEIDMANARFANDDEIAKKERELLRSQLAFKLRISEEQANRLLFLRSTANFDGVKDILTVADPTLSGRAKEGIAESFSAKDIELRERATGDFFAGWQRGLQKYTRDTESSFGMAQDMARRTAQGMEQGFQKFFFDGMEGKFNSFKNVLDGVLSFTKQIVSQIAAQMMTVGIIKPGAGALSNLFSTSGKDAGVGGSSAPMFSVGERFGGIERFAMGGISSRPRTMALGGRLVEFGEGPQAEAFVPLPDGRTIPVTMKFASAMPQAQAGGYSPVSISMPVNIINQHESAQVETRQSTGPNGSPQLDVLILNVVNRGIAQGKLDKAFSRFGSNPQPVRR